MQTELDYTERLPRASSPEEPQQSFMREGSAPRSNSLPFHLPFLIKRVLLSVVYLSLTNSTPFTYQVQF